MSKVVILKNSPHFSNGPSSHHQPWVLEDFSQLQDLDGHPMVFCNPQKDKVENSPTKIVVPSGND